MDKQSQLSQLKEKMEKDTSLPLRGGATQLVFGEGKMDADIYCLGEAPGYWEDKQGRPFVGQAGKLLDSLIENIGMKRADVYISNIVRFRPPQNRDPLPDEIEAFKPYVDAEIEIINPKIIVTLGRFSLAKFLPYEKISAVHGKPRIFKWQGKDVIVIPMYHPAAALRSREVMSMLKEDFKKITSVLKEAKKEKVEQIKLV